MTTTLVVCVLWTLVGVVLSLRCTVLVMLPAMACAMLFAFFSGDSASGILVSFLASFLCLQTGYLTGAVVSKFIATRQPRIFARFTVFNKREQ